MGSRNIDTLKIVPSNDENAASAFSGNTNVTMANPLQSPVFLLIIICKSATSPKFLKRYCSSSSRQTKGKFRTKSLQKINCYELGKEL